MSLETQIAALVAAANNLTTAVDGKIGTIDQKVAQAQADYAALINGIRGDFPFYALTQNQALKFGGVMSPQGTATQPDGWTRRRAGVSVQLLETVVDSQPAAQRPAEVQALLQDIYGSVPDNLFRSFNIIKITFNDNIPITENFSIYQGRINRSTVVTYGAFVKVVSGDIRFGLSAEAYRVPADGKWHERLFHKGLAFGGQTYEHGPHLFGTYGSVALLALPAAVAGKVPPGAWMMFNKPKFVEEMGTGVA